MPDGFKCDECGKTFATGAALGGHRAHHSGAEQRAERKAAVAAISIVPTDKPPSQLVKITCPECGETVKAQSFGGHVRTLHPGTNAYALRSQAYDALPADIRPQARVSRYDKRKPITHNTTPLACPICGKVMQHNGMRTHLTKVHKRTSTEAIALRKEADRIARQAKGNGAHDLEPVAEPAPVHHRSNTVHHDGPDLDADTLCAEVLDALVPSIPTRAMRQVFAWHSATATMLEAIK